TTLLEYFPTEKKTVIWVVTQKMLNVVEIPLSRETLEEKVRSFRKAIERPDGEYEDVAKELYTLLIWPIIPQIKTERLAIIPHGILHYLPFQALFNGTTYLVEEYSIFSAPSASLFVLSVQKRKEKGESLLAFANTESDEATSSLPYTEEEVLTLASLYTYSTVYLGESARESLAKALAKDAHILHLASYGQLLGEAPLSSYLRLTRDGQEDGRLEIGELFTLDLQKTTLVILSASQTLRDLPAQGDELTALVGGFLYAGAPSTLFSLWNANSSSNVLFMDHLHAHLKQRSKAEALRLTQLEMLRGEMGRSLTHPFFWAPFILAGDWQ
ncbi:MAG: CHAT domain-containing protein, partial [Candidatus Tectomicrobia bacterium]|nr:CHAT domain-containing protein [Candidatus Tectomicrobia bacterium]